MIESWSLFVATFLFFTFIGFAIYLFGSKQRKVEKDKDEMYKCGEQTFPDSNIGSENFYRAIKENLKIKKLQKIHSGNLTDYIQWIIAGVVIVIVLLLVLL